MPQVDTELIQTIRKIRSDLGALDPNDRDALVRIGAALQHLVANVPKGMDRVLDLLSLCLEGSQAIYRQTVTDPQRLVYTISGAMVAAQQLLLSPANPVCETMVSQAVQAMRCALDGEASGGMNDNPAAKDSVKESPLDLSLDDVAALLVQLEPTDPSDLMRVRYALNDLASRMSFPASVRTIIAEAARKTDALVQGKASDPHDVLAEVGRLIEVAMYANDFPNSNEATGELSPPKPPMRTPDIKAAETNSHFDTLSPDVDANLLGDFVTESRDFIERAEAALLSLEADPDNMEAVNTVFRAFHTIKGTSAFLGLTRMSELAHRGESLLSRIRDHEIHYTGGYADLALHSVDMLNELIQAVQGALGGEPMVKPDGYDELMRLLADPEATSISDELEDNTEGPLRLGDILVAQGKVDREKVEAVAAAQGEEPLGVALLKSESASLTDIAKALRTQHHKISAERAGESSVRVRTERLDRLIDMVGELVIAHSMVAQDDTAVHGGHYELLRKMAHTGKIVRELQDLSMSMRMVPLKASFQKMARLVRDLAHKSGKSINFITEGEDTEIDRNMVDIINDPLLHLIRNAVDHGVEPPDVREKSGKPRIGTVWLSAYHSGGSVVIEVQDDGKGLDRDKIIKKAMAKGLIEYDKGLSDSEVFNLIFTPGFSTADKVTDVSGRGVGLDVVRRNVEVLRGRIDISSEAGKGCTFSLRLPLTLAITDGMLVKVGDQRYIMPTVNINITFRPDVQALSTVAGRGEMVRFRGNLLPIFRLHRLFNIKGAVEDPTSGLLVIVNDRDRRYALLVDELLDQQQVVAKSLGDGIGQVQGISGGAILGDGRVGLILDPLEVAALARQVSAASDGK